MVRAASPARALSLDRAVRDTRYGSGGGLDRGDPSPRDGLPEDVDEGGLVNLEPVDLDAARKLLKLVDALEDSDDVQDVYTNIDIPDDVAAALEED